MHHMVAATLFYMLCILFAPILLAGYVLWVGKSIVSGRNSGVSGTAQGPLSARVFAHRLGTRPDEPANRLLLAIPGISPLGVQLVIGPIVLAHRLTGYMPKAFRYPFEGDVPKQEEASARIAFFDDTVTRYLADRDQFVILGAGFDTRPYRFPRDPAIKSFEVDLPQTQAVKRAALARAGIDTAGVTFVPADFEQEDWLAQLVRAGFDPHRPALFLWEGVIVYLDRAAVEETLRKIAGTARGTIVAFDYFTSEVLTSQDLYWRYARVTTRAAGEPLKFGVDSTPPVRDRLAELLNACGLALDTQRTLGDETHGRRAWGGFATAIVQSTTRDWKVKGSFADGHHD